MTLKTRNRLEFVFFLTSTIISIIYIGFLVFAILNGRITPPENAIRPFKFFKHFIFNYRLTAVFLSLLFFIIYVPVCSYIIHIGFQNTQSIEIIYFMGFLISCFLEETRLILLCFNFGKTYSVLYMLIGRAVFASRMLAFLSMLFSVIYSGNDSRKNVEQNFIIMLVVSVLFGTFVPLDTMNIYTTATIFWGYNKLFTAIRVIIFLITLITMIMNAVLKDSRELGLSAIGYLFLMIGYSLMLTADNFFILIIASVLFILGNFFYLKSVHKLYMWQ